MFPQNKICVQGVAALPEGHNSLQVDAAGQGPWHVLHVRSNYEKRVAQHLVVRAVEHYLPLYRERVKWTDRTVIAERPLQLITFSKIRNIRHF